MNSKRMAVNGMVKPLCKEEKVGFVDLWDSFVGKEEMYVRDRLHLSGKGLPFLPRDCQGRLPVAWVKYDIYTSWAGRLSKKAQNVQEDSRCKGIQGNTSKA